MYIYIYICERDRDRKTETGHTELHCDHCRGKKEDWIPIKNIISVIS